MNTQENRFLGDSLRAVKSAPHRIGDLLVKAGFVSQTQFDSLGRLASAATPAQTGQMLIMSGLISHEDLTAVLQAQSFMRDRVIDETTALNSLRLCKKQKTTFEQALKNLNQSKEEKRPPTNRLGELLIEAGVITIEQFEAALNRNLSTGLPLGRILVLSHVVSESILLAALNAQVLVRDGTITRQQALSALAAAFRRQVPLEQPLKEEGFSARPKRSIRLGELFIQAGIMRETEVADAIEIGLSTAQPVGRVFLAIGSINEKTLEAALELQKLVSDGFLELPQAAQALTGIHHDGKSSLPFTAVNPMLPALPEPPAGNDPLPLDPSIMDRPYPDATVPNGDRKLVSEFWKPNHRTQPPAAPETIELSDLDPELIAFSSLSTRSVYHYRLRSIELTTPQEPQKKTIEFNEFLCLVKLAEPDQVKKASQMCAGTTAPLSKALVTMRVTSAPLMDITLRCYDLINKGWLSIDEAVFAIDFCKSKFVDGALTVDEALEKLGWEAGLWQLHLQLRHHVG